MTIQLLHSKILELSFQLSERSDDSEGKSFLIDFHNEYDEENDNIFSVVFQLEISHPGEFQLKLNYVSWFQTSEPIDREFKESDFPSVNAPAIAFPFLRSYVSMLTLNGGHTPTILPSINFHTVKRKNH